MANKDCFAYGPMSCRILTERICDNKKCGFYKTRDEIKENLKKYPPFDYKLYKETGQKIYYKRGDY